MRPSTNRNLRKWASTKLQEEKPRNIPRSEELDEDRFTVGHFIVVLFGELDSRGTSKKCKSEEDAGVHFRIESKACHGQDIYNN